MYSEGVGKLYLKRLRPITFRDSTGNPLPDNRMVEEDTLSFSWESCELLGLDFNSILNMYVERPDYIIRGYWVPTIPTYGEDGSIKEVKPFNSFILDTKGPHTLHILGMPLGDDDSLITSLQRKDIIFKNSFSDKQKKLIYYITK